MERVEYGKSATREECNLKKVRKTECNTKKVRHKESAT